MSDTAKETTPAEDLNPQDIDFSRQDSLPTRKEQTPLALKKSYKKPQKTS